MWTVFKEFTFDSAHKLPNVSVGHKCGRVHGHTYHVKIVCAGQAGEQSGWVIDYADIAEAWEPLNEILDHRFLNDIAGLENSTSEHLARWIWDRLSRVLRNLLEIEVRETCTAGCTYRG